jgi:hypothetical protein
VLELLNLLRWILLVSGDQAAMSEKDVPNTLPKKGPSPPEEALSANPADKELRKLKEIIDW